LQQPENWVLVEKAHERHMAVEKGCMRERHFDLIRLFSVTVLLFSVQATIAAAQETKLTYSGYFQAAHSQSKVAQEWCREVEKRTSGKVKIEYYPGQTLARGDACYEGVTQGISDIGFSMLAFTRIRFPLIEVIDLPLGYKSALQATKVANAILEKFNDKVLTDTKVMYLHAHGPGLLHTRGKAVRSLEDLSGLRIRGHGTSAKVIKALGGTPVAMPIREVYGALDKGVLDGAVHPVESNRGLKLGEVIDFLTQNLSSAYTTGFFVVMNKDRWNSLPDDVKKTIQQINTEWISRHAEAWDLVDADGYAFLQEKKREIIIQDEKESARWAKAARAVLTGFVEDMKKKDLPGQEVLEFAEKTLREEDK
jgi:TRAP-type transport system periplasmic protein